MGPRHITPIVILIIQLYGASLASNLPQLAKNRLSEGSERVLPNAIPIYCNKSRNIKLTVKSTKMPTQVLSKFRSEAFTAGPVTSRLSPQPGKEARFKFAQVQIQIGKTVHALVVDDAGESAYWLPQGESIEIPRRPNAKQPHYVFTPNFSGCSWTVTPLSNGLLRLRHVHGGQEAQFNNLTEVEKGGNTTYAIEYKDYGYIVETHRLVGNVPAFAYMHFSDGQWTLYFQRKSCSPEPGAFEFKNNVLKNMIVTATSSKYPTISSTKAYTIP